MRLVDTSAWIEWLINSPTGNALVFEMPAREDWLVPTIVQLELSKWLARSVDEDMADQVLAFAQKCVIVPLDSRVALLAAEVCARHKLATADAIIYATATEYRAELLTCDAHFGALSDVRFIPKIKT